MKKLIVAIFAFLYIITSSGVIVYNHYCMDKLADWGIGYNTSNTCSKCGMNETKGIDNGCCKDEHKFIKNDTVQKTAEVGQQMLQMLAVALPVSFTEIPSNDFHSVTEENPISHAPPRSCSIAVYIRNCVFLI